MFSYLTILQGVFLTPVFSKTGFILILYGSLGKSLELAEKYARWGDMRFYNTVLKCLIIVPHLLGFDEGTLLEELLPSEPLL